MEVGRFIEAVPAGAVPQRLKSIPYDEYVHILEIDEHNRHNA